MGIILFNTTYLVSIECGKLKCGFRPLMGIILFNPVFETTGIYWSENTKNGGDYKTDLKDTLVR